jgi:IPT/TIG domain-containing protein
MRRTIVTAAAAIAGVLGVARAVDPVPAFSKVAETGDRAAGLPSGISYSAIELPMVDGSGTFLFDAQLDGGSQPAEIHDSGVFLGKRGALQLVARAGDVAPGTGGAAWSDLLAIGQILRAGGRVAFPGEIAGADTAHDGGLWAGTVGALQLVAREGDPAPGTTVVFAGGNRYFQDQLHLAMNDSGAVAFRAKLAGTGVTTANDQALFAGMPGALSLVARLGAGAPDAGGATFTKAGSESFTPPSIDASGKILFRGHLVGQGVTPTNADAIWFGDPAAPTIAVRGGQAVSGPGIPPNSTLTGLGAEPPVLNDAGQILFEAPAFDGATLNQAVWLRTGDALAPIAVHGQTAPLDSKGATFTGLFEHLRLNADGQAAFHALLSSDPSDWGLYAWDGATLRGLARTGDPAPGMPAGETFGTLPGEDVFINAAGRVLFRQTTLPSSIVGVWLADAATGSVQLLARTDVATPVDVDGTSEKIIDLTLFSGPDTSGSTQDGRSAPLGDDGTYAILAQFLDGHLAVLTNAAGSSSLGTVTPTSLSVGTTIDVTGSGFGGGAAKFRAPAAWLTAGSDPRKIPLKVDAKTASDTEFHATLAKLRKGASGPATLHVQAKVKGAPESQASVRIEPPHVDSVSAASGAGGDLVTITGRYFGSKKRQVLFLALVGDTGVHRRVAVKSWTDGAIVVVVPKHLLKDGAAPVGGVFEVDNDAGESNVVDFTVNG